jgi:hypothetical protein
MLNALKKLQAVHRFDLEIIDIDEDATLRERFNADVPVLARGEQIICKHFYNEQAIADILHDG